MVSFSCSKSCFECPFVNDEYDALPDAPCHEIIKEMELMEQENATTPSATTSTISYSISTAKSEPEYNWCPVHGAWASDLDRCPGCVASPPSHEFIQVYPTYPYPTYPYPTYPYYPTITWTSTDGTAGGTTWFKATCPTGDVSALQMKMDFE